jgi:hypothetical protein
MTTPAVDARLRAAAIVAYVGAALYVALLAVLHVVQPHMIRDATISRYALGNGGWMIQAAFIAAGVAYAGLAAMLTRASAVLAWLTAVAFVVMGIFVIDSVGPMEVVSIHGAMHTGAFFVVVALTTVLMFLMRSRARSTVLRILPFIAPVLVVAGFFIPGLVGALIFRAWTLSLVLWVVLAAHETAHASVRRAAALSAS